MRAWKKFYSPRSIWDRWTVSTHSSWIQTLGFLPLNVMQNRLVKYKILGGKQRFRSASDFDPMSTALQALAMPTAADARAKPKLRVINE
jgi:hypothetical protein